MPFILKGFFLNWIGLNVARYLTVSLRGPVLAHYDEADRPSWCRKRYPGFKILLGLSHFFFAKMFYPPKGVCFADSHRGPIVFTLHFIGVGRGTQDSKSYWVYRIFFFAKMFYCDGLTGGRLTKRSFNFFYFEIY